MDDLSRRVFVTALAAAPAETANPSQALLLREAA